MIVLLRPLPEVTVSNFVKEVTATVPLPGELLGCDTATVGVLCAAELSPMVVCVSSVTVVIRGTVAVQGSVLAVDVLSSSSSVAVTEVAVEFVSSLLVAETPSVEASVESEVVDVRGPSVCAESVAVLLVLLRVKSPCRVDELNGVVLPEDVKGIAVSSKVPGIVPLVSRDVEGPEPVIPAVLIESVWVVTSISEAPVPVPEL